VGDLGAVGVSVLTAPMRRANQQYLATLERRIEHRLDLAQGAALTDRPAGSCGITNRRLAGRRSACVPARRRMDDPT
jgi:hypothetical protein